MNRNRVSARALASGAVLIAACSGSTASVDTRATVPSPATTATVVEAPTAPGPIRFPTGADDVVLLVTVDGGSDQPDPRFTPPILAVTGAGEVVRRAPPEAAAAGQFLATVWTQTITPTGIERLLAAARDDGLFADRSYDADIEIADQATTTVRVVTDDGSWTHRAYALGAESGDVSPERRALRDAVERFLRLEQSAGPGELGPLEFYLPAEYLFQAAPVDEAGERPVVVWSEFATVALADAATCQRLPELEVGEVFETAAAGSLIEDDGTLYDVVAVQAWPGSSC